MVSVVFISGFILRNMNDLFITYLKNNVVSHTKLILPKIPLPGKVILISIKLDIQVWSKRMENLFLNNLLNGQSHQRKTYSTLATQDITFQI